MQARVDEHKRKLEQQEMQAAMRAAMQPPVEPHQDPVEQIKKLAGLRDAGVLSDAEFDAKKAELLAKV